MRELIRKFMVGRYGLDDFGKFLLKCYLFLLVIDILFQWKILFILEVVFVIFIFYRIFSKDVYKRVKENRHYMEVCGRIRELFRETKKSFQHTKTHVYKKCPKCKTMLKLKLPKTRGIKHTTCPDCHTRFAFLCLCKRK